MLKYYTQSLYSKVKRQLVSMNMYLRGVCVHAKLVKKLNKGQYAYHSLAQGMFTCFIFSVLFSISLLLLFLLLLFSFFCFLFFFFFFFSSSSSSLFSLLIFFSVSPSSYCTSANANVPKRVWLPCNVCFVYILAMGVYCHFQYLFFV